jgi:recombination protein RecT
MSAKDVIEYVKKQESKFKELDKANGNLVDFGRECLFARQQILKNSFTLKVASENPTSLQAAILNVASIGITLNPATQHAYLVPRDGQICLDISFRGLVYLATDAGAIKWARAELVYENDDFEWRGPNEVPLHKADPFSEERGEMRGGYVIAKMPDGDVMVETMSAAEINKVRDTSKAFKKGGGPWIDWPEEMAKKTIIKRAYKSWPQTPARRRLDSAVEALHETEGTRYTIEQHERFMKALHDEDEMAFFQLRHEVGTDTWCALFNSFPKGQKTKQKDAARQLEKKGAEQVLQTESDLQSCLDAEDPQGVYEVLSELNSAEREFILGRFEQGDVEAIERLESQVDEALE